MSSTNLRILACVAATAWAGCNSSHPLGLEPDDAALPEDSGPPRPDAAVVATPDAAAVETPDSGVAVVPPACAPPPDLQIAAPATEADRVFNAVLDEHMAELYRIVGRYARGDASIYAGRFSARDNQGAIGAPYRDGVMDDGEVIASLAWEDWRGGRVHIPGDVLIVYSPSQIKKIEFAQPDATPSRTDVSMVLAYNVYGGADGQCSRCVPSLADRPAAIAIDGLVASGTWGTGAPLRVEAHGRLDQVPIGELTFEHLVLANGDALVRRYHFVARGDEMVRPDQRPLTESEPVPVGTGYDRCERSTQYRIEWYVNQTCLADYGVRDVEIVSVQTCCYPGMLDEADCS